MKGKNLLIIAGAAVAALLLLRYARGKTASQPAQKYWVSREGNTGYPPEAQALVEVI